MNSDAPNLLTAEPTQDKTLPVPQRAAMRRYCTLICAVPLLCAAVWLLLIRAQLGAATESSRLTANVVLRKLEIAQGRPTPKLLIVGASGTLYGFRAETLERNLGVPVVNFGLTIQLKADYLLDKAETVLRPGDTVLLALEYHLYPFDDLTEALIDYVYARDPEYLATLPIATRLRIAFSTPPSRLLQGLRLRRTPHAEAGLRDRAASFNANGDETDNLVAHASPATVLKDVEPPKVDNLANITGTLNRVAAFARHCRERRIRVLATFPNALHLPFYDTPVAQRFFTDITRFYHDNSIPVLGRPEEYMFALAQMFDTQYHLNDRGTAVRTARTLAELRPYFSAAVPPSSVR